MTAHIKNAPQIAAPMPDGSGGGDAMNALMGGGGGAGNGMMGGY
jgi:hypothetical protein